MKSYCRTYFTAALVSFLLLVPLPASATTEVPSPIEVRFHEFSNGMGLYHVKVDEATNFKLSVTVWVGSVDEDPEVNGGVSHLLEHILFHQPDMSETEFKAQVESQGGSFNGKTAEDYTQYYVNLPARHLDLGQNWFYRVLVHDRLVTDRLEEEKEIVNRENEWSTPTWLDQLWKLIEPEYLELPGFWERNFGLHEYGQPVEGTYKVGSKLTAAQLEAHYRKYYYTENMVLLYVGPHELDEVIASLAPTFGSVPATGMKTNLHPLIENQSPRPYFSHDLTNSQYNIGIGHVFTGLLTLVRDERPLAVFSLLGGLLIIAALVLMIPVFGTWAETGKVPRFPTAILASAMTLAGLLSISAGLVLDTVTRGRQEMKRMFYLLHSAPALRPTDRRSGASGVPPPAAGG